VLPKRPHRSLFDFRKRKNGEDSGRDASRGMRAAGLGMSIPFALLTGPLVGYFLGAWLDGRFCTSWITPVAVLVGLAGSIQLTVRMIRELSS